MMMCETEILNRVREIIAKIAMISVEQVKEATQLGEELHMESLAYVDLQFELEVAFGVEFYHGSVVDRLAELLARYKLEVDG